MEPPVFTPIFDSSFDNQSTTQQVGASMGASGDSESLLQNGYYNEDGDMFVGQSLTDEER